MRAPAKARLGCFELAVASVETGAHEGVPVTSGVTFSVEEMDPKTVVSSWGRQLDALRAAGA